MNNKSRMLKRNGGSSERIYYIMYRKGGKLIEEKAGRQYQDDMTPARASGLRAERIAGKKLSNKAERELKEKIKRQKSDRWTIDRLWEEYLNQKLDLKGLVTDQNRYENYIQSVFGDKEPCELIPLDIDRLRVKLLKTKAPGTVKNVLELLRRIINFGADKRLCRGISFKIQMPRVNNEKTEDLSPDQLESLLQAIQEDSLLCLWPCTPACGVQSCSGFNGRTLILTGFLSISGNLKEALIRPYRLMTAQGRCLKACTGGKASLYSLGVGASRERTFIARRTESGTRRACQGTSGHCMACGMYTPPCLLQAARLICIPFKSC